MPFTRGRGGVRSGVLLKGVVMSKSHRIPSKGGDEADSFSNDYQRMKGGAGPGVRKWAKRNYNRRQRRALKPTEDD